MIKIVTNPIERQLLAKYDQFVNFLGNIKHIATIKERSFMVMLSMDVDNILRLRLYRHGKHSDSQCYALGIITADTNINATIKHMAVALNNKY